MTILAVGLGQAVVKFQDASSETKLGSALRKNGFKLLQSGESQMAERIKVSLIHLFYYRQKPPPAASIAHYLEMNMHINYQELDKLFSSLYTCSIEQYTHLLRFERAKELLSYKNFPVTKIVKHLGYESKEILSKEFEKRLNVSLSQFLKSEHHNRIHLDQLILTSCDSGVCN